MRRFLIRFFINAAAIGVIVSGILPGIRITGNTLPTLVVVALIFGLINTLIKPIVQLLTCPVILLTMGLFMFIINGVLLYLTAFISGLVSQNVGVGGTLQIDNLLWAIVGSIIVTAVSLVLERLMGVNEPRVVIKRVEIRQVTERTRQQLDADWDRSVNEFGDDIIDPKTGKPRL
jgi:putative membrane protein